MSLYEFLLFVHILAAATWFGSGLLLQIQASRAESVSDDDGLRRVIEDAVWLATRLFIPASLVVLVAGFGLVSEGDWSLGNLWLVLGLLGYAATFLTGIAVIKPRSERIAAIIGRDGGMSPVAAYESRKLLALARIDYVVLLLVIADMAIKPSGDDVVLLIVMAAVLVAGTGYTIAKANGIPAPATA
jgi:uncharacterized membrane protein